MSFQRWKWYVYIIQCADNTYYTGITWNPAVRAEQHQSKFGSKYTALHGFIAMVYIEEHEDINVARLREKKIKNWSQEKKKKLITGKWVNQL